MLIKRVLPVIAVAIAVVVFLIVSEPFGSETSHPTPPSSLFGDQRPEVAVAQDSDPVEVGLRFTTTISGLITGLRFYKGGPSAGTVHRGTLWDAAGDVVAETATQAESESGWQVAPLDPPIPAGAGDSFVASIHFPAGNYPVTDGALSQSTSSDWAILPVDAGVYRYASDRAVPQESYRSSNYFVDIEFQPGAGAVGEPSQSDALPTASGEGPQDSGEPRGNIASSGSISSGLPAFASSGDASLANDEDYDTAWHTDDTEAWLAYDLSSVPAKERRRAVLAWYTQADDAYTTEELQGVCPAWPGRQYFSDYVIEVNTADGGSPPPKSGWKTVTEVRKSRTLAGQHRVDLSGVNWIRLRGSGPNGVSVNMDLVDASGGAVDGWLFLGDSITSRYADHRKKTDPAGIVVPTFADLIADGTRGKHRPLSQNGGMDCAKAQDALAWIEPVLEAFPGRYVTLNFGTNDGWGGYGDPDAFYWAMEALVAQVVARGKTPVVSTIPWPNNGGSWQDGTVALNDQIKRLYREHPEVVRGPDLFKVTKGRPKLFSAPGDVHPNGEGAAVIRKAWAEAALRWVYNGDDSGS